MNKEKKVKIFCCAFLFVTFLIATAFQFSNGIYVGIHGKCRHLNNKIVSYPYNLKLTFTGHQLHRVEFDSENHVVIDNRYFGGSSTSNGLKTSYIEKDTKAEILVGVQGGRITIDTKPNYEGFQNHIEWERSY